MASGGQWERVPHPKRTCDTCAGSGVYGNDIPNEKMRGTECYHCKGRGWTVEPFYSDRDYDVFAMLADVRNGTGFAGIDTGDGYVPISTPKGFPSDMSDVLRGVEEGRLDWCSSCEAFRPQMTDTNFSREEMDEAAAALAEKGIEGARVEENEYGKMALVRDHVSTHATNEDGTPLTYLEEVCPVCGGELGYGWESYGNTQSFWLGDHSFSYLTVKEIQDYFASGERTSKKRGWVDPWEYTQFKRTGKPSSWSGGISGPSIEHISNAAMDRLLESEIQFEGDDEEWESKSWSPGGRPYTTSLQRSMSGWDLPKGSVGAAIAEPRPQHYTLIEWETTYAEEAERFVRILERDIVPLGPPEAVRLVFGFDS